MPVSIHGKEYFTVAERIKTFREHNPDWSIQTELVEAAEAVIMKAAICNSDGMVMATGYAEEVRGSTNINKTSALENCETSAIGRALSAAGYAGTEYASADEVANAIKQQADMEHIEYMNCVRDNWLSIEAVKRSIATGELTSGVEAIAELDEDIKKLLWKAPTKGGVWTTEERAVMKSNEWHAARESYYGR